MKKYFIPALLIMQISVVLAQQIPLVSYFMYDYARTNPGSLGSNDMICVNAIYKETLVGMPGRPKNFMGSASMPFKIGSTKHGAGLSVYTDEIGLYTDVDVRLAYAFRFNLGNGTLGIGLKGGLRQKEIDASKFDANGSGIDLANDLYIPKSGELNKGNSFGFGAGIFYRAEDVYFGASVINAYATEIEYPGTSSYAKDVLRPHYFVTAGYGFQLSNPAFEIDPAVQFYSDGVSVTFDINGTLTYNKKLWTGVSYRAGASIVALAGLELLGGLKAGIAYDLNTSAKINRHNGSFELLLNYCFKMGVEKTPERYKSIRYL